MLKIDWAKQDGLLPVIVQDINSKEVLMLAYMNEKAYELSLQTRLSHFYSRSKQRIWKKGETSGNLQKIKEIYLDCDNDTLLLQVEQIGVACHTGRTSCFFQNVDTGNLKGKVQEEAIKNYSLLDKLYHKIQERKNADPKISYVASLEHKGENSILKKVGEEATELCLACKDKDKKEIIYEAADLCFHALVALSHHNIHPDAIKEELKRRMGISGIEEKKNRKVN